MLGLTLRHENDTNTPWAGPAHPIYSTSSVGWGETVRSGSPMRTLIAVPWIPIDYLFNYLIFL
jgi:hypothetical protein